MCDLIKSHNQKYVYTRDFFTKYICYSEVHALNVVKRSFKPLHEDVLNVIATYLTDLPHHIRLSLADFYILRIWQQDMIAIRCMCSPPWLYNTPGRFILNHHIHQWTRHECIQCRQHVPQFKYYARSGKCSGCIARCSECDQPITDTNSDEIYDLCSECFADIFFD